MTVHVDILVSDIARVHHIQLRVRDDRDTPLWWSGRRQNALLLNRREAKYFFAWGWTLCRILKSLTKFDFPRTLFWVVLTCLASVADPEVAQNVAP